MTLRRIVLKVQMFFLDWKHKRNSNTNPDARYCLDIISLMKANELSPYRPGDWAGLTFTLYYPHLDLLNEALVLFNRSIDADQIIESKDLPDYKFTVTMEDILSSRHGYYPNVDQELGKFIVNATTFAKHLHSFAGSRTGPQAHHLRILNPILVDVQSIIRTILTKRP